MSFCRGQQMRNKHIETQPSKTTYGHPLPPGSERISEHLTPWRTHSGPHRSTTVKGKDPLESSSLMVQSETVRHRSHLRKQALRSENLCTSCPFLGAASGTKYKNSKAESECATGSSSLYPAQASLAPDSFTGQELRSIC